MSTVYSISKFDRVFIKSDSKKAITRSEHGRLPWISWPTSFDSAGYHALHDEFQPIEVCALYGAFAALVQIAAGAPVPGILADNRGQPFSIARLVRESRGMPAEVFEKLIEWGLRIGWIQASESESRQCRDDIPTLSGLRDGTERDGTTTERNGTGRKRIAAEPSRADVLKSSEAQETQIATNDNSNKPAEIPLHIRARSTKILKTLQEIAVKASGVHWTCGVFKKFNWQDVTEKPMAYWIQWYIDQLSAQSPVFRMANRAEMCFVVAAIYAVRRATEDSLKGRKRIARWIHWMQKKETNDIADADFAKAAAAIATHFGEDTQGEPSGGSPPSPPPQPRAEYKPDETVLAARKQKTEELKKTLRSRGTK